MSADADALAGSLDGSPWLAVKNTHTSTVPPYGAMKVSGRETDGGLTLAVQVTRPDADNIAVGQLLFNGPEEIAQNKYGRGSAAQVVRGKYTGAAPAVGDAYGTKSGQWDLEPGRGGFLAWGDGLFGRSPEATAVGAFDIVRVTGAASASGGLNYYPGVLQNLTTAWADGATVWLNQRMGHTLRSDGAGYYLAVKKKDALSIGGDSRPVYATTLESYMIDWACVSGSPVLSFAP